MYRIDCVGCGSNAIYRQNVCTGPNKQYLMNSSTFFLPTDSLTMNSPVYDARTVVINSGVIGGLDSLIPAGIESRSINVYRTVS